MGPVSLQQGNETHARCFNPVSAGKQEINHPNRYVPPVSVISYQEGGHGRVTVFSVTVESCPDDRSRQCRRARIQPVRALG